MKAVPREKVRRLKDYARLHGATRNDVLLTAYIRALYRHFGRAVVLPCVVDLRKYLPNPKSRQHMQSCHQSDLRHRNRCRSLLDSTLKKVKEKMDRQKADIISLKSILLMETGFRVIPYGIMGRAVDPFFSNPPTP